MGNTPYWLKCPRCASSDGRFTGAAKDAANDLEATGNRVTNTRELN